MARPGRASSCDRRGRFTTLPDEGCRHPRPAASRMAGACQIGPSGCPAQPARAGNRHVTRTPSGPPATSTSTPARSALSRTASISEPASGGSSAKHVTASAEPVSVSATDRMVPSVARSVMASRSTETTCSCPAGASMSSTRPPEIGLGWVRQRPAQIEDGLPQACLRARPRGQPEHRLSQHIDRVIELADRTPAWRLCWSGAVPTTGEGSSDLCGEDHRP